MLIDCDSCVVKGAACGGCVVSVMLGAPPAGVEVDEAERRALAVLADAGMVPHLRLVTADSLDLEVGAEEPAGHPTGGRPAGGHRPAGKGRRTHMRRIA
jgi:hypothetical protein